MALKITEVQGKLVVEGNMNSVTRRFLKQHIDMMNNSMLLGDARDQSVGKYRVARTA